ncbi:HlyD family secretion protein [uncultured Coleofasciculus sp.]|uniref:HlyD family secretion protein n=1 Tax=uncultured Coleofasciculus sp. TaxID=1267456 RepID=A0A6J4KE25_9CYAN|nr:HlyD family secretion protein [uncultured Coleofasciculus sp.]
MELPLIGKVKRPLPWLMGLMAAGIVGLGGVAYVVVGTKTPKIDLNKLTVPTQSQNLTVRITANGKVQPIQSVNLSPKTAGRLAKLLVEQGDRVQQGQVLAQMEDADLQARLSQARANLSKAQASLAEARAGSRPEEIRQANARLLQAQARLDESRAGNPSEIDQAKAQVESAQSRLDLARKRADRFTSLAEQGAQTLDKRDEALSELRNAQAALNEAQQRLQKVETGNPPQIAQLEAAVAEAQAEVQQRQNGKRQSEIDQFVATVKAAEAEVQAAEVQLKDTVVIAPFTGIVTQKYATVGAFVAPSTSASSTASATSTSILALAKGLEILAKVPEVGIRQIKPGQMVEVVADAFPDQVFKGRVQLVAPEAIVDQNVTSFQVRIALDTGQNELRSGMNVNLTFLGENVSNALVVPTVAIVTQKDGKRGVLVPDADNKPKFKPVTTGPEIQTQTQILEGLKQGERVFIAPPEEFIQKQKEQAENEKKGK